ncbi:MAG TPA: T9SS type A sorting domain-containing protein [Bacteroidia bacterium]
MKRIVLIAVLFCVKTYSQTNKYHKFPDSAAVWNIHLNVVMSSCPPTGSTIDEYYSITISGDTLISSKTYHKLFTPFVQIIPSTCASLLIGYQGAIRQDTLAKKVFIVPPTNTSEQLLYDFTMQVGDTVKGFLEPSLHPDKVQSIDSVLVGSTYHKRWNINNCYNIYLIEGIGSTYGLIVPSPYCGVDAGSFTITCFKQNGQALYPNTTTNCDLLTSVVSIEKNSNQVSIYPNPAKDILNVECLMVNEATGITISDILGNAIYHSTFNTQHKIISVADLAEGVYNISISSNEGVANKRLVIVR